MIARSIARQLAVVVLGAIVPIIVLAQAYLGIASLGEGVGYHTKEGELIALFTEAKKTISQGNDYALFSLLYTEHANQKTMINKQVMKVSIMQIGFAVISVGMMFIVLGINDGGAQGAGEFGGVKFDFKSGSTGVIVFVVGAIMATAGGVLKNDYNTVPIPNYLNIAASPEHKNINAYKECKKQGDKVFRECFVTFFEKINAEALK